MTDFDREVNPEGKSSDLEFVLALIQDKKDQIKALGEEIEHLFASLPESKVPDVYPAGRFILTVRENRRFNDARARQTLSKEEYESILVAKADTTLARKKLTGEQFEDCQVVTGVVRDIKEVTDDA